MKLYIFFALFALAAASPVHFTQAEIDNIVETINNPLTKPEIVDALRRLLERIREWIASIRPIDSPIHVGPAFVDEFQPPHVEPAYVEDYQPPHIEPALVDDFKPVAAPSSPLVQIIVNVKNAQDVGGSPVAVEGLEPPVNVVDLPPFPEIVAELPSPIPVLPPTPVEPVQVVDIPTPVEPVQVVDIPTPVEPVMVAPIIIEPVQVAPEILN